MGIIAWIILGLLAGAIAKAILPGDDPGGIIVAMIVGIVGAFLGGFLAQAVFGIDTLDEFFDLTTWLTAIVGAIVLLMVYRGLVRRRVRPQLGSPPAKQTTRPQRPQPAVSREPVRPVPTQAPPLAADTNARKVEPPARRPWGVFISYRRQDTPHLAGRLSDRLREHFGPDRVFIDVDSIEPGLDFGEAIDEAVNSCAVMLVLIGDKWLTTTDDQGRRRIDDPDDYVRIEVEAGIRRDIRVVPILIEGATMPGSSELPDPLGRLARRNALEVGHSRFNADAERLINTIERVFATTN